MQAMLSRLLLLVTVLSGLSVGCSQSDGGSDDRREVASDTTGDAAGKDAGPTKAGVDPNGGRDSLPASCFAACQNTAFACQATGTSTTVSEAELQVEGSGCTGTIKPSGGESVALKLDCTAATVCTGSAPGAPANECAPATFSAFTFGYTPNGGTHTVCTRN